MRQASRALDTEGIHRNCVAVGLPAAIHGIHRVIAIGSNRGRNLAFYTEALELRLVQRSVDQDDVSVYARPAGGVLFEFTTKSRGYTVDKNPDDPEERLPLSGWLEDRRSKIELQLPKLATRRPSAHQLSEFWIEKWVRELSLSQTPSCWAESAGD